MSYSYNNKVKIRYICCHRKMNTSQTVFFSHLEFLRPFRQIRCAIKQAVVRDSKITPNVLRQITSTLASIHFLTYFKKVFEVGISQTQTIFCPSGRTHAKHRKKFQVLRVMMILYTTTHRLRRCLTLKMI